MTARTLEALNALSDEAFVDALSGVFERAPWVAAAAVAGRPYAGVADLFDALRRAVTEADDSRKVLLLNQYPALGRPADAEAAPASRREHAAAGLDALTEADRAAYARRNGLYLEKFGFPFVLCVRRHGADAIAAAFERRLASTVDAEREAGVAEAVRIAALRLTGLLEGPDALGVHGRLSTHVLDTARGRPAAGVPITLWELVADDARLVARALTNPDGRTDAPLIAGRPIPSARYELRFEMGAYFAAADSGAPDAPFLDVIPVRFTVAEPEGRYHVPLTATPWAYATYRGS